MGRHGDRRAHEALFEHEGKQEREGGNREPDLGAKQVGRDADESEQFSRSLRAQSETEEQDHRVT